MLFLEVTIGASSCTHLRKGERIDSNFYEGANTNLHTFHCEPGGGGFTQKMSFQTKKSLVFFFQNPNP